LKFKLGKYYEAEDFVGQYIYHVSERDPKEYVKESDEKGNQ